MMNADEMIAVFKKHVDEYGKFDRIKNTASPRADLHAFVLLDLLSTQGTDDIVAAAEHDEIFLAPSLREIAAVITEEQVIELIRCGVRISEDSFAMFV